MTDCNITQQVYGGAQTVMRECLPNTGMNLEVELLAGAVLLGVGLILAGALMLWAREDPEAAARERALAGFPDFGGGS